MFVIAAVRDRGLAGVPVILMSEQLLRVTREVQGLQCTPRGTAGHRRCSQGQCRRVALVNTLTMLVTSVNVCVGGCAPYAPP